MDTRFFGLGAHKAQLMSSVLLGIFLSSLDQTIVSTAMPTIVRQLGGLDIFSWVFTAYMVTSTIAVMLSGKLGDMRGRKTVYFWGIVVFIVGSILAGLSENMLSLILSRAFQGIGGGVMMANSMAIIADIFPPAERGKWQGLIAAVFAVASIAGPLAGALITEHFSWHWIFFVNLPVGIVTLYLLSQAKQVQPASHSHALDLAGAFWFTVFMGCGIVYLVSGLGSSDAIYLLLLACCLLALGMFLREEARAPEPVLQLTLFQNRIFTVGVTVGFISAVAMFGSVTFLPLIIEEVFGRSISDAGATLTPLLLAQTISSALAGQVISRTGRYKTVGIIGCALICIGLYLVSSFQAIGYDGLLYAVMALGAGVGILMPLVLIVVQNAFEYSRLGMVTSAIGFFRVFGGVVGVSVMGSVINIRLGTADSIIASPAHIEGFHGAFLLAFLLSIVSVILMFYMKEIPLKRAHEKPTVFEEVAAELVEEEAVIDSETAEKIRR
jgi:EmrB/QacA subfamily drug resistance transporter